MANFSALKTAIQNAIRQNGNEEITGDVLQQILLSVVNTMGDGAINTIEQNLSNETLARQNGDNTLQSNINAEALARGNADTQLQNAINAIKANIDNGYVYAGIATTTTEPVSGKVFYIATAAGTYTNFGGQVLTQGINILRYNGSAWSSQQLIGIDDVPTAGSGNLVKSGGAFNATNTKTINNKYRYKAGIGGRYDSPYFQIEKGEIYKVCISQTFTVASGNKLRVYLYPEDSETNVGNVATFSSTSNQKETVFRIPDDTTGTRMKIATWISGSEDVYVTLEKLNIDIHPTVAKSLSRGILDKSILINYQTSNRSKFFYYVDNLKYANISVSCLGYEVSGEVYNSFANAIGGMQVNVIETIQRNYVDSFEGVITNVSNTGWLAVSIRRSDNANMTEQDYANIKDNLSFTMNAVYNTSAENQLEGFETIGRTSFVVPSGTTSDIYKDSDFMFVEAGEIYEISSSVNSLEGLYVRAYFYNIDSSHNIGSTDIVGGFVVVPYIRESVYIMVPEIENLSRMKIRCFENTTGADLELFVRKVSADNIFNIKEKITILSDVSEFSVRTTDLRYKFYTYVEGITDIKASCEGYKVNIGVWDTIEHGRSGTAATRIDNVVPNYNDFGFGRTEKKGFLFVSFANTDTTAPLTLSDVQYIEENAQIICKRYGYNEIPNPEGEKLFIGTLKSGYTTNEGLYNDDKHRVSMKNYLIVPSICMTVHFKMPYGYVCGIRAGGEGDTEPFNTRFFKDGDIISNTGQSSTLSDDLICYRLTFGKTNNMADYAEFEPEEIQALINSGDITITYTAPTSDKKSDIILRNSAIEKKARAMLMGYPVSNSKTAYQRNIIISHFSDIHGDVERCKNFFEYSRHIGANIAICTGDVVAYKTNNSADFFQLLSNKEEYQTVLSLGNHDGMEFTTDEEMYDNILAPLDNEKNAFVKPFAKATYYYVDNSEYKLRIISLNQYEGGNFKGTNNLYMSQTQWNWLISTLQSTPAEYGIIICMHATFAHVDKNITPDTSFISDIQIHWSANKGVSGYPLRDLIDAFIERGTLNQSYSQHTNPKTSEGTAEVETFTLNADFTNVDSSVEFISYMCGHSHYDEIGYMTGARNKQLSMMVTCGVGAYGNSYYYWCQLCDLPRGLDGSVQDAFNVFSINRDDHTIRIARIGSNYSYDQKERSCMVIKYKDE